MHNEAQNEITRLSNDQNIERVELNALSPEQTLNVFHLFKQTSLKQTYIFQSHCKADRCWHYFRNLYNLQTTPIKLDWNAIYLKVHIIYMLKLNMVWGGARRLGFVVWLLLFWRITASKWTFSLHILLVLLFLYNFYCTWVAAWASESRSLAGWYKPSWISTSAFSIHKWGKESVLSPFPVTAFSSKPWKIKKILHLHKFQNKLDRIQVVINHDVPHLSCIFWLENLTVYYKNNREFMRFGFYNPQKALN